MLREKLKAQNFFILVASYFFYGWWDWRFLGLIFLSSIVDYLLGLEIAKTESPKKRKTLLSLSLLMNLGALGFFKYYNFFVDSFITAFDGIGFDLHASSLNIILPVGISFYTFQTLSYTIDIYRKKTQPTSDVIAFFSFVSFFPQLVAGPIERASNLLPQFFKKRTFNYEQAVDGLRQMLFGFFKKMVIADNCAIFVDEIFNSHEVLSGSTLLLGAIYFAFQIYGDFSGYSDIAIGTAKLFGFDLMVNFRTPYFSRDIAEFWRRWHISLSTWFRDYVYIPLGGSKNGVVSSLKNIIIIFVVSGFWHGANWTFIFWGFLNALFFIPLLLLGRNRKNLDSVAQNKFLPSFKEVFQMGSTFLITCVAWVFFRADSLSHAFSYLGNMFDLSLFSPPSHTKYLLYIVPFVVVEWVQREKAHTMEINHLNPILRKPIYYGLFFIIFFLGYTGEKSFIYFQF